MGNQEPVVDELPIQVCKACKIRVRLITPARVFAGPGSDAPYYIHVSVRSETGDASCGVRELDVSEIEYITIAHD